MSLLIAMLSFSFAMSISPGPVNMMIVSSGASYGARRTFAFVSGAAVGFTLLLLAVGFGFIHLLKLYPMFLLYLSVAGAAFIVYQGYKLILARPDLQVSKVSVPKFFEGFLLQWLNPKAWAACVSGASLFSQPHSAVPFLTFSFVYFLVCYGCLGLWSVAGEKIYALLGNPKRLRLFNTAMGLLLIATATFLVHTQLAAYGYGGILG